MKITILTVCYNSEKYLERTLRSVISQDYSNIEFIVIDGASTDASLDIIAKYKDSITYFVSEPDKNMYDAINKGIRMATGDYLAILNSDDFYVSSDVISQVVQSLKQNLHSCDGIYGNILKFDSKGVFLRKSRKITTGYKELLCSKHLTFVGHGSLFVSRNSYLAIGEYDCEHYSAAADFDYVLRLFSKFRFRCVNLDIMGFTLHENSITSLGKIDLEKESVLAKNGYYSINPIIRTIYYYWGWFR